MMKLPYNHCDPPDKQIPLPIKLHNLPDDYLPSIRDTLKIRAAIPTASANPIVLELYTDSIHLAEFFSANWPSDRSMAKPHAKIIALKQSARFYGLPNELDKSRWFCPKSQQVWMFDKEYYGNLKITVRGLCSEFAPFEEMFLHGCSVSINEQGVVLAGMSGAGKTTLTSALRCKFGQNIRIVNDDWGAFSLTKGSLRFTGEHHLHMKYPSVRKIAPNLVISPNTHPSENFQDDVEDPRARLLISPAGVYGKDYLQDEAAMKLFVVVLRNLSEAASFRQIKPDDVSIIENGQYSAFYNRTEWFLNGSLFLLDDNRRERIRKQHQALLARYFCITLNNSADPNTGADLILKALGGSAL